MLVAVHGETRVSVLDPLDEVRVLSDARRLTCPHCHAPVVLKAGPVRARHFAHTGEGCERPFSEPESDEHRLGKLRLYEFVRRRHPEAEAWLEHHIHQTNQWADVGVVFPGDIRFALEFQRVNNSIDKWNERRRLYRSARVRDIWFLGAVRYRQSRSGLPTPISPYDPIPVPRDVYGACQASITVSELEKAAASADQSLVFFDPEQMINDVRLLLVRGISGNTLRAYQYSFSLEECEIRQGRLWSPVSPLLEDYRKYLSEIE